MLFGFPRSLSPAPGHPDLERAWERNNAGAPEFGPYCERGVYPIPGGSWDSGARSRSVPVLKEASPSFGPVQLKLVSHEPRGSGNPGCGRGRARREGAAQSTYMSHGPADGCQEFPMRGDGGKFGQLGLANGEPREGFAPSPSPPPASLRQRECVRPAQCAWRLGPSAPTEPGSPRAPAAAAADAASSSLCE